MSPARPASRASAAIAAFSTVVEWYDFTLYLYFATTLARVFFGGGEGSLLIALAGAIVLALVAGGVSAVATAEQLGGEGRLTGLALGATTATAIFGGLTPLVAQYATKASGWPSTPGLMIAIVALAVLPLLWRMKETAPARQ